MFRPLEGEEMVRKYLLSKGQGLVKQGAPNFRISRLPAMPLMGPLHFGTPRMVFLAVACFSPMLKRISLFSSPILRRLSITFVNTFGSLGRGCVPNKSPG